ncbi:hypothetical protein K2X14_06735 [Acetobacter sp. TBRC 12305]|uniref:DUF6538 domain-containing protein n=2 Tax=Acetobacter garciniae TaxID=2817435 RepID=A0A939HPF4_9PROT|nr:DUF6538 domain-containing protein [Acetobacter garciniae]MBO1324841.1 hypothetical protein [Acetobacter garciniae]MBX0344532.1 hypothetical protein [Acetobacter garciniae]
MLRLLGSHYHFRRTIPHALRPLFGRTEISLSLQTDSKRVARERAAALYARTGQFFSKASAMYDDASPDDLKKLITVYEDIIKGTDRVMELDTEREKAEHASERASERAEFLFDKYEQAKRLTDFLATINAGMARLMNGIDKLPVTLEENCIDQPTTRRELRSSTTAR